MTDLADALRALVADYRTLCAHREQAAQEDAAMLAPFAANGHVTFTAAVLEALGPRFVELERTIARLDDEIERYRTEHFDELLDAILATVGDPPQETTR
jgi:hypothetical protein